MQQAHLPRPEIGTSESAPVFSAEWAIYKPAVARRALLQPKAWPFGP
jgi:hypothetical protein